MLEVKGHRSATTTSWRACYRPDRHTGADAAAEHVDCLEERLYYSLNGLLEESAVVAAAAGAAGQWMTAVRAELVAIDVRNRTGEAASAKGELLELLPRVPPDSALAGRIRMRLATACDRLGERTEAGRWIREALTRWPDGEALNWRSEALMISALIGMSNATVDYALVHHAAGEIATHGELPLLGAALANFAEVAAEGGELAIAAGFADSAAALLRRHPEISQPLTLDSIARARLALGELAAADYGLEIALRLEATLHCTDVNGDPWLTFAEVRLAQGQPDQAWQMLDHPRRASWAAKTSWTRSRDSKLRAQILAAQQRWREAYQALLQHLDIYEGLRSVEGDRVVAEFATAQLAEEERRRAAEFERMALTDPLTGLPNRRSVERWLAEVRERPGRDRRRVALAIIDLDHFKRINDSYSHEAGDEALRRVAEVLIDSCPASAEFITARLGGEEFVQLSLDCEPAAALGLAERMLGRLRTLTLDEIEPGLRITASVGIALGDPGDPSGLLRAADRCLYQAKRAGRNQIVVEGAEPTGLA